VSGGVMMVSGGVDAKFCIQFFVSARVFLSMGVCFCVFERVCVCVSVLCFMSVRVCIPSYLILLYVSILSDLGRAASGGALAPEPPRVTRSQSEPMGARRRRALVAARPLDRTRVMRTVQRGEPPPKME